MTISSSPVRSDSRTPLRLRFGLALHTMQTLALSKTSLHYNALLPLFPSLPRLSTLLLAYNAMSEPLAGVCPASLRSLDLTGNCFSEWSALAAVNAFPSVISLCLEGNPIGGGDDDREGDSWNENLVNNPHNENLVNNHKENLVNYHNDNLVNNPHNDNLVKDTPIENPVNNPHNDNPVKDTPIENPLNDPHKDTPLKDTPTTSPINNTSINHSPNNPPINPTPLHSLTFPHITSLNVAATPLVSLRALLARFPALTDLELRRTPWYVAAEAARGTVIALCPALTQLNGATVTAAERREEEVAFVRREVQRLLERRKLSLAQLLRLPRPLAEQPELEVGKEAENEV